MYVGAGWNTTLAGNSEAVVSAMRPVSLNSIYSVARFQPYHGRCEVEEWPGLIAVDPESAMSLNSRDGNILQLDVQIPRSEVSVSLHKYNIFFS